MIHRLPRAALACVLALTLGACGGGDSDADEASPPAETGADAEAAPSAEPDASGGAAAPVAAADLDRWQTGLAAELEAVRKAGARMREAKTNEDTLSAMMAVQEMATQEIGARAAAMNLERYRMVHSELSAAVSYLTPHLGGIDTTMLSPEQRVELRQSNEAQLKQMEARVPAEVVAALRPRAAELRKLTLELVAERLKSVGM